ncbi:hypothetical protein [Marinilabilia salmonicolor]|uniref:hypothetical protein n=1 Tax=Marinilabilia salmonicolor TaxID=989 RepID=UPI00029A5176|nr:hypothetical protein [Marinilabilia salmonicolor]
MKILTDREGNIHITETENREELFLEAGREVYVYDNGPTHKQEGGPFDEITAYSDEGEELRKEA